MALNIKVGGNVHAVSCVQGDVNKVNPLCVGVLLNVDVEEVQGRFFRFDRLKHVDVDVLPVN